MVWYDVKGKKYFEYPSKYYCTDIGLRNARLNFRQQEETHIMENIIYNELISRGYLVDVGVVEIVEKIDETRVKKQCEIDFVVNKGTKKYYIQSALSVSDSDKLKTNIRPLLKTKDFFKKILISKTSMKPFVDENGILHLGLYEFLLNEDSLELWYQQTLLLIYFELLNHMIKEVFKELFYQSIYKPSEEYADLLGRWWIQRHCSLMYSCTISTVFVPTEPTK